MTSEAEKLDKAVCSARDKFWESAKKGASLLMDKAPVIWNSPEAKRYRAEKRIIMKHLEPFYTGAFVTAFFFVTFRVSGSQWYSRFREKYIRSVARNIQQTPNQLNSNKVTTKEWKSFLEKKNEEKQYMESDLIQLPIDIILSVLCGCSSVIWLSRPNEIHKDFAEIPLVSGSSVVHEYVCHEFESAYRETDIKVFEKNNDDDTLKTFQTFVKNCQIRSEYIHSREAEGYDLPDVIPYPGLKGIQR